MLKNKKSDNIDQEIKQVIKKDELLAIREEVSKVYLQLLVELRIKLDYVGIQLI